MISDHRSAVLTDLSNFGFHLKISTASLNILALSPLRLQNCFLVPSLLASRFASFGVRSDMSEMAWKSGFAYLFASNPPLANGFSVSLPFCPVWLADLLTDLIGWLVSRPSNWPLLLTDWLSSSPTYVFASFLTRLFWGVFSCWPYWQADVSWEWLSSPLPVLTDCRVTHTPQPDVSDGVTRSLLWNSPTDGVTRFLSGITYWLTNCVFSSLNDPSYWLPILADSLYV